MRTCCSVMGHFYSGCIHTYVPTASVKSELEFHDVVTDGVRIWTRGVDTRLFNPSKRCPQWRQQLGVAPDVPIVIIVCRLVRSRVTPPVFERGSLELLTACT